MVNTLGEALATLWTGKCTIFEQAQWTDYFTKTTQFTEINVATDEPCRISYSNSAPAAESDSVSTLAQQVILFLRPDLVVKPGSKITVTQNGRVSEYKASGAPKVYTAHQEVPLALLEDKA